MLWPLNKWFISRKNLREEMKQELLLAREDERQRVEFLSKEREKEAERQLKRRHEIDIAQVEAEVESQKLEIARFLQRESNVATVYYNSIRQTKKVLAIAVDISHEMQEFTEDTVRMFQKVESITQKSKRLNETYEKESGKFEKLLAHNVNLNGKIGENKKMVAYYQCKGETCGKFFDEFDGKEFKLAEEHKDGLCMECREAKQKKEQALKLHRQQMNQRQPFLQPENGNGNGHSNNVKQVLIGRKEGQ